jgi:hypothetical protein
MVALNSIDLLLLEKVRLRRRNTLGEQFRQLSQSHFWEDQVRVFQARSTGLFF